jgi:hypothetical protein
MVLRKDVLDAHGDRRADARERTDHEPDQGAALNLGKLGDAFRLKPIEEFRRGARIGAPRVRIPDLGGEEFEEAIGGA